MMTCNFLNIVLWYKQTQERFDLSCTSLEHLKCIRKRKRDKGVQYSIYERARASRIIDVSAAARRAYACVHGVIRAFLPLELQVEPV